MFVVASPDSRSNNDLNLIISYYGILTTLMSSERRLAWSLRGLKFLPSSG